jgi:mono/diheme cytochrome c family protein
MTMTTKLPGFLKISAALFAILVPFTLSAQKDTGVRGGAPNAGGPVSPIQVNELALFTEGKFRVTELEATCDGCSQVTPGADTGQNPFLATITNSAGLGARFNADQCMSCHAQPAIGGSGGFMVPNPQDSPKNQRQPENPMFDLIPHRKGMTNYVPSFITQYGPIREVRFVKKPDGTPDGGVHQLFTIIGRTDDPTIPGCNANVLPSIDFETQYRNGNLAFRIPLQLFGLGLIDSIQDIEILSRHDATAAVRASLGIVGTPNRSGNDGTITRFGWKAQNKSLTMFSGEAYNVEMGVTNELFPQSTEETPACNGPKKNHPNDTTRTDTDDSRNQAYNNPAHMLADWMQFAVYMRFLDGPQPIALSPSATQGLQIFNSIGCAACHTPQMMTAPAVESPSLTNKQVNLYSDLLIHHMGPGLADNVSQGLAGGDQFRSTPLWGLGQRIFLLHDGRTTDLIQAILAHSSVAGSGYPNSEANAVVANFQNLGKTDQQSLLNFLRSL